MQKQGVYLMSKCFPISTFSICLVTFLASTLLATYLHGIPIATVTIKELKTYGGFELQSFSKWNVWSLFTAQLVHVKQLHMFFNVVSLFLLGASIEKIIGRLNVFLLWLIAGSFGTIISAYFSSPPFNVGTGASQAVFAFMAVSLVIIIRGHEVHKLFKYVLLVIAMLSLLLDIFSVYYPKPGHVTSFLIGLCFGLFMVPKKQNI